MLNIALLNKIWLKNEEAPILVIRSSLINWLGPFLVSGLLLLGAFFLMYFLWQFGLWGLLAFSFLIVLAIFIFSRALYEHYFTGWVLTNLRLIDLYQRGFFHRETSEVVYDKIKEAYCQKAGIFSGLFGLGDVYVALAGSRVKLMLGRVRGYDRAVSEIILQQENYLANLFDGKERRAQYQLQKIKNKIGADALSRLLGD